MTKDSIIEQALMRIKVTDGTNQIGEYLSDAMDEYVALIDKEPVTFLLSNALRHLTLDQQRQLCNALQERLAVAVSIEEEAARMYPYTDDDEMGKSIIDCMRSAHIACAGTYTDTIDKLKAENESLKAELNELKTKMYGQKHNL